MSYQLTYINQYQHIADFFHHSSSKDCNASSEGAPLDLSLASSPDENAETFQPNDIVWAKIFGFPWWPAVV
jgi:hypothetical protein